MWGSIKNKGQAATCPLISTAPSELTNRSTNIRTDADPLHKGREKFSPPLSCCDNAPEGGSLDTLAQLRKRARAKYVLQPLLLALIDEAKEDPDEGGICKSYWQSYHCVGVLQQKGQKLEGKYCNQRWCLVCSRIRTAKLINKYRLHFEQMKEPHFVTLTAPTITAKELPIRLKVMKIQWKMIQELMRKRGTPLVGVRKIEVTYNAQTDKYHPHFHALIDGRYESEVLREEWLSRNETAKEQAQDVREADPETLIELFKYTAKHCSKGSRTMNAHSLHIIYKALRGLRTFQSLGGFGTTQEITEEGQELELNSVKYPFLKSDEREWIWEGYDWKNKGEPLTGYEPSEAIEKFRTSIEQCNVTTVTGSSPPQTNDRNTVQTYADKEHLKRAETQFRTTQGTITETIKKTEELEI